MVTPDLLLHFAISIITFGSTASTVLVLNRHAGIASAGPRNQKQQHFSNHYRSSNYPTTKLKPIASQRKSLASRSIRSPLGASTVKCSGLSCIMTNKIAENLLPREMITKIDAEIKSLEKRVSLLYHSVSQSVRG